MRARISGSRASAWVPFCAVTLKAPSGTEVKLAIMFGQWPPVCSSCQAPARNVGTSISSTKLAGARASPPGGNRSLPTGGKYWLSMICWRNSRFWPRSSMLKEHCWSPAAMRFTAQPLPIGSGQRFCSTRSVAHPSANPSLKMPPG